MNKLIFFFFSRKRPLVSGLLDAASRLITALRPQDVICLPAGFSSIEDMWGECQRIFGYRDDQVIWYPIIAGPEDPPHPAHDEHSTPQPEFPHPGEGSVLTAATEEDWARISGVRVDIDATMKGAMTRLEEAGIVWRFEHTRSREDLEREAAHLSELASSAMHDVIVERAYVDRDADPVLAGSVGHLWPVIVPMFVTENLRNVLRGYCVRLFGDAWESVVQKSWLHPPVPEEAVAEEAARQARGETRNEEENEDEEEEDEYDITGTGKREDDPLAPTVRDPSPHAESPELADAEPAGAEPMNTKDPNAEAAAIAESRSTFVQHLAGLPPCATNLPFLRRGVDVPRGYRCKSRVELLAAYRLMKSEGVEKILLKPSDGSSSGKGIEFGVTPARLAEYPFDRDAIVTLEEEVPLARAADGSTLTPVYHYLGGKPIIGPMEQIIFGASSFGGNVHPPSLPAPVIARVREIMAHLQNALGYQGWWGLDMLVHAETGRPLLTDLNTGRPNGGHRPSLVVALRTPSTQHFRCWRQVMPPVPVSEFMRRVRARGLAFGQGAREELDGEAGAGGGGEGSAVRGRAEEGARESIGVARPLPQHQRGLLPLMYLPGRQSHMLMVGRNAEDLAHLLREWESVEHEVLSE